jgi:hypothetical protein
MMERMPQAVAALAKARAGEAERLASELRAHRIVGVLGEAEVGKTQTIRQALRPHNGHLNIVYLDLSDAAGDGHVGFLLAKQIARTVLGEMDFSLLSGGVLLPARVELGRQRLADLLGIDGHDEALRMWPSGGFTSAAALDALATLVQYLDLVLWIDHVESPRLTPRHPLDVDGLLWGVRELSQRASRLRVLISAREALRGEILGSRAAFHQQGRWLSLDAPATGTWQRVAEDLGTADGPTEQLASLTGGHPTTMMLALLGLLEANDEQRMYPEDVLQDLAMRDDGMVARALQHARTLHRLGGQVLTQVALGQRPYAGPQRGTAAPQEIRKILNRLRMAGLLRHTHGWATVNPLVAIRLRGTVHAPPTGDGEEIG